MERRHGARREGVWGKRGLSPLVRNLSTRWRWVLKFMPWSLYPAEGAPPTVVSTQQEAVWTQRRLRRCGEERSLFRVPVIEPRLFGCPASVLGVTSVSSVRGVCIITLFCPCPPHWHHGPFVRVSISADCGPWYGGVGYRRYVNRLWGQFITPALNHVLRLVCERAFVVLLCIILRVFKSFISNIFCVWTKWIQHLL